MQIVRLKVPELGSDLARQAVEVVHRLRTLDLKKDPSISETLDWARALVTLNASSLNKETFDNTLAVLLKHESDVLRARRALNGRPDSGVDREVDDWDVDRPRWRSR
jgi:hypothetical protein